MATEVSVLHGRYVRLADRFKSMWTFHQFATGVFKAFVSEPPAYKIDFQRIFDGIKHASGLLTDSQASSAAKALDSSEAALDAATRQLLKADDLLGPSLVRRFFEKLRKQDESVIHNLIKFYLYADAVEGDRRDKLDFLFTRIGEDFISDKGEYVSRDSLEFRERVMALVSVVRVGEAPKDEIVNLIRAIRTMREDLLSVRTFDELTQRKLLRNTRTFKHRIGDLYFQPDVLLAIVELNVVTKNRFMRLYEGEEQRIVEDARKLMEHGPAIEASFGDTNPALIGEIARFREFKERFDESRAQSNVKHDMLAQLKASMSNILAQLDRGLDGDEVISEEIPAAFFAETHQAEAVTEKFGRDDVLLPFLLRIAHAIDPLSPSLTLDELAEVPAVRELRLEAWEIAAHQKLFARRAADCDEDNEELWIVFLRASALRVKVDEEATILATAMAAGVRPEADLLARARASLESAKELDELFGDFLQEAVYYSNPRILHQLYRSRFRLLRGFSGLWLIYDRQQ
ncbi:MAG TPA: hypothetical protein VGF69_11490 [Thermoanaerobaculia bacterium]|jgi:hypothetical protein